VGTVTAQVLVTADGQAAIPGVGVVRLLFIGGTSFIGRHAVELAVDDGHEVTVFHRGRTNPGLLAGKIDHRLGDRDAGDYASIDEGVWWDAVIDVCAYVPRHVHQLADVLGGRAGRYVQVSSVSAYDPAQATVHEDSPLYEDPAAGIEDVSAFYGPLKAACERAAAARFGEVALVRPAYVCGPYDPTDSFTYWVRRMAEGGEVVVPDASAPMQIIDVRDLGAFLVRCATTAAAGAFDGVGPFASTASMLAEITPPGVTAHLVEIDAATLAAAGITLPMMDDDPNDAIISSRPGSRARAAGPHDERGPCRAGQDHLRPLTRHLGQTHQGHPGGGHHGLAGWPQEPSPEHSAELCRQSQARVGPARTHPASEPHQGTP
jgi:nucleoside-diphosphate-sugar epimerase